MDKHEETAEQTAGSLADDARELLEATQDIAGAKVAEARRRLAAALEKGKELYVELRETAAEGMKATDRVVRESPYVAVGIAFGAGALLGYWLSRPRSRNGD